MVIESQALKNARQRASGATSPAVAHLLARLSDRYAVDRKLGQGGMGVVYLARDAKLGRRVAVKVLDPVVCQQIGQDRFLREIRLTASLQHPHILPVLDSGCIDGVLYHITPYVAEGSLYALLQRTGRLSLERVKGIALDLLGALDYAHAEGIVHCDIKPENILLSNGHAILTDFGIARTMSSLSPNENGDVWGSPVYMSPEQASGEMDLDGRSDLYSLACVIHEMLVGSPPFTGGSAQAVIAKKFSAPAPDCSALAARVPPLVAAAVVRALSVDPAHRFTTADAFAAGLAKRAEKLAWHQQMSFTRWRPVVASVLACATLAAALSFLA